MIDAGTEVVGRGEKVREWSLGFAPGLCNVFPGNCKSGGEAVTSDLTPLAASWQTRLRLTRRQPHEQH
jgi:hypothetical protein